jgi:hypothetical protein
MIDLPFPHTRLGRQASPRPQSVGPSTHPIGQRARDPTPIHRLQRIKQTIRTAVCPEIVQNQNSPDKQNIRYCCIGPLAGQGQNRDRSLDRARRDTIKPRHRRRPGRHRGVALTAIGAGWARRTCRLAQPTQFITDPTLRIPPSLTLSYPPKPRDALLLEFREFLDHQFHIQCVSPKGRILLTPTRET